MHGIRVEESGVGVTVGVWGEFDAFSLPGLREALDDVSAFGKPVLVDLSGVTFLDLQSARELVVRSVTQADQIAFENPSFGVLASTRALGLKGRRGHGPGREDPPVFLDA